MHQVLTRLWQDDAGFVISAELILVATIVVIGLIVGLAAYRDSIVQELGDTAAAVGALNQSYSVEISGAGTTDIVITPGGPGGEVTITGTFPAVTVTSTFNNYFYADELDVCEDTPQMAGEAPACISFDGPIINEGDPIDGP